MNWRAVLFRLALHDWQPDRIAVLGDHSCCCPCTVEGWKQRGLLGVATDLWAPVGHDHERLMQIVKELRAGYDGPNAMESRFPVAPTAERARMCDGHCDERLTELTDLGVTSHIVMQNIFPGWTAVYLRPDRPGEFAGHQAIALARSLGQSTICAGTGHVAAIVETVGAREAREAVEIGSLKAIRRKSGAARRYKPSGPSVRWAASSRLSLFSSMRLGRSSLTGTGTNEAVTRSRRPTPLVGGKGRKRRQSPAHRSRRAAGLGGRSRPGRCHC